MVWSRASESCRFGLRFQPLLGLGHRSGGDAFQHSYLPCLETELDECGQTDVSFRETAAALKFRAISVVGFVHQIHQFIRLAVLEIPRGSPQLPDENALSYYLIVQFLPRLQYFAGFLLQFVDFDVQFLRLLFQFFGLLRDGGVLLPHPASVNQHYASQG